MTRNKSQDRLRIEPSLRPNQWLSTVLDEGIWQGDHLHRHGNARHRQGIAYQLAKASPTNVLLERDHPTALAS